MKRGLIPKTKRSEDRSLAKHGEWNPFEELHREIDELFDGFLTGFDRPLRGGELLRGFGAPSLASPSVDVVETDNELRVTAELPGMDEKDIEVTLDSDALIIRGEKKEEHEDKKKDYHLTERSYGSFERVIPMLHGTNLEKAVAKFKKGVLTVTIPKTEEAKNTSRRIDISAE